MGVPDVYGSRVLQKSATENPDISKNNLEFWNGILDENRIGFSTVQPD